MSQGESDTDEGIDYKARIITLLDTIHNAKLLAQIYWFINRLLTLR